MGDNRVQALDRAIDILEELSRQPDGLGVTGLGSVLGLHKSTVHRLLNTLMHRGYVEKNISNDKYRLGLKVIELGQSRLENIEIRKEARPFLKNLMKLTNETVHLSMMDNGEIVYIDKVESLNTVRMCSRVGLRAPVHCTAMGKAVVAFWPDEKVRKIIKEKGLVRKTNNTITDYEKLLVEFDLIRKNGYAVDNEENDPGIRCVAAPVRNYSGEVIASISVSGPSSRITKERIDELASKAMDTALNISRQLGYRGNI
ncbi:IclR family transcriptional regulator [Desulfofalx alkaliphila]|uniref:IclR family transcriptional regulator n=1 Tax=Desulfofalx alkaliphila TaxID=105483 RepID=UPI0004E27C0A|nr:IclR family transcriptional regulator [Desulfofalx alkaliphila]